MNFRDCRLLSESSIFDFKKATSVMIIKIGKKSFAKRKKEDFSSRSFTFFYIFPLQLDGPTFLGASVILPKIRVHAHVQGRQMNCMQWERCKQSAKTTPKFVTSTLCKG